MATNEEEIQNALLAIHARLGTIEGKVNLVARAERDEILKVIEKAVRADPLLGQIYLLLDGKRTQREIVDLLAQSGIAASQPTVSRRMKELLTEYGLADPTFVGTAMVLRKDAASDHVLNLTTRVQLWLEDDKRTLPVDPGRRKRKPKA